MILISIIIYISFFIICFLVEINRNRKWDKIVFLKSRLDTKGITMMYVISFIFMFVFTIINIIIGKNIALCIFTTMCSLLILLIALLCSRKCIILTDKELIKQDIFTKSKIAINEIKKIDNGYFYKVYSKYKVFSIESKFYDRNIEVIKKELSSKGI